MTMKSDEDFLVILSLFLFGRYDLIPLTAANQEYNSVKKLYNKTMSGRGCEILEIFKVQNILLWQTFTRSVYFFKIN